MIVGFSITDFKGHEEEAIAYISKVCILDDAAIAKNIVESGVGINIFSSEIDEAELKSQPFLSELIETQDGKYLLASSVNFNLELLYNGRVLKLVPTEYIYIEPDEVSQFIEYYNQGLIKIIPNVSEDGNEWILGDGSWRDDNVWLDSEHWKDE